MSLSQGKYWTNAWWLVFHNVLISFLLRSGALLAEQEEKGFWLHKAGFLDEEPSRTKASILCGPPC